MCNWQFLVGETGVISLLVESSSICILVDFMAKVYLVHLFLVYKMLLMDLHLGCHYKSPAACAYHTTRVHHHRHHHYLRVFS